MTELDHASAETTTETSDRPPAAEQRPGSSDQTRYPSGVTDADKNPGYYDGDIKAALAADTTPTRQQAAHDDASNHQAPDKTTTESHDAPATGHDPDIEAILHENDNLPEPRTRQEAARVGFPSYRGDIALKEGQGDGRDAAEVRSGLPGGRGAAGPGDRQADRAGGP